jgi:cytochrome c551/c552
MSNKFSLLRQRHLIVWLGLAGASLTILAAVVSRQDHRDLLRWSVFLSTNPEQGSAIFREKGCVRCHAVNGAGGKVGPDLGAAGGHPGDLPFLISAMWNHAPNMWKRMQDEKFSYPSLSYENTAHLMAYLFIASHMDSVGDAHRGKSLFTSKGCITCHNNVKLNREERMSKSQPNVRKTPMEWSQAMWASAPTMEEAMQGRGMIWPQLNQADLNDLFAYQSELERDDPPQAQQFPGDPERGWQVFQEKSCITCHSLTEDAAAAPLKLLPRKWRAPTFSGISELMWNHAPAMDRAMHEQGIARPSMSAGEMTDLIAFVYSLQYFDPPGSALVGKSIFGWRGCSMCHGKCAEGTHHAPGLRGHGKNYNSISLATALWSHGPRMYNSARTSGVNWPNLQEDDIGDLLAFLNSPISQSRSQKQP